MKNNLSGSKGLLHLAVITAGLACGDDSSQLRTDSSLTTDSGNPNQPDFTETSAWIRVNHVGDADGMRNNQEIAVRLSEQLAPTLHHEAERVGNCRRLVAIDQPLCDPPCLDGLCTATDQCTAFPLSLSAGDISLTSATQNLTMVPPTYGDYREADLFQPGETVTATALGDGFPAFELSVIEPVPLVAQTEEVMLGIGKPLTVQWTPSDPGSRIAVRLIADRHHGEFPPSIIECDLPDEAGTITVDQDMIDQHANPENWACGKCFLSSIQRYRKSVVTTAAGPLAFEISSQVHMFLHPVR